MENQQYPTIIQGGMGVGVSGWQLAKAVSEAGQMGVVSGTALDTVMVRRLQLGDEGGHVRRALAEFPLAEIAERIVDRYLIDGGKPADQPFAALPLLSQVPTQEQQELLAVANFVEVYLAKEEHDGLVGINYLEKIQLPTLPSLFGAMLAGVDYVLMGAGIPSAIPEVLDRLAEGQPAQLDLRVEGAEQGEHFSLAFDPEQFTSGRVPYLRRPKFLPIVASSTLATRLARNAKGVVDGFVVEGPTAGGHNAPPRGQLQLNGRGEPVYGKRDEVDLEAMRKLGLPFWLAGSYGSPTQVADALEQGAAGVQVGTAFAFCEESGMRGEIRRQVLDASLTGEVDVRTDPVASPAGFPFKVLSLLGSLSESALYQARKRRCDIGLLRQAFRKADGTLGWRCPAEPEQTYANKGGQCEQTADRKCICNALLSNIGLGQLCSDGSEELTLVTCGDDASQLRQFLPSPLATTYSARNVVDYLLSALRKPTPAVLS